MQWHHHHRAIAAWPSQPHAEATLKATESDGRDKFAAAATAANRKFSQFNPFLFPSGNRDTGTVPLKRDTTVHSHRFASIRAIPFIPKESDVTFSKKSLGSLSKEKSYMSTFQPTHSFSSHEPQRASFSPADPTLRPRPRSPRQDINIRGRSSGGGQKVPEHETLVVGSTFTL